MTGIGALLPIAALALALSTGLAAAEKKDEAQIQQCIQAIERDPSKADRICKPAFQILEDDGSGLSLSDRKLLKECKAMAARDQSMGESDIAKYDECKRVMDLYLKNRIH